MLSPEDAKTWLQSEFDAFKSAPLLFVVAVLATSIIIASAFRVWYKKRLADKDAALEAMSQKASLYESKLKVGSPQEAEAKVKDLETRAAGTGPQPAILADKVAAGGTNDKPPEFRARFLENGRDATFYIEYSAYHGGIMGSGGWTATRVLKSRHLQRFIRGEQISFPIFLSCETAEGTRWFFASEENCAVDKPLKDMIRPHWYRGRITILAGDDHMEHTYF